MKTKLIALLAATGLLLAFAKLPQTQPAAWEYRKGDTTITLLMADGFAMVSKYNTEKKHYYGTYGGPYTMANNKLEMQVQFAHPDTALFKKTIGFSFLADGSTARSNLAGSTETWNKLAVAENALDGNWRIREILRGTTMEPLPLRARRTLKLLAGGRFQWAAINTETGEFFGTGGGAYTFAPGKYTETLYFFSRDSNRVGATLQFKDSLQQGAWLHTGRSSKGDTLREVWMRAER